MTLSKDIRNEIIIEARKLFLTLGYHKTTMRNIAQAVGISTSPLYAHFKSKTDVFVAICQEGVDLLLFRFQQAAAEEDHAAFRLRNIFYAYRDFYIQDTQYFQILQLAFNPLAGIEISEELLSVFFQKKQSVLAIMLEVIEEGIQKQEIRAEQASGLMLCLYSLAEGIFMSNDTGLLNKYNVTVDQIIEQAIALVSFGMLYLPE